MIKALIFVLLTLCYLILKNYFEGRFLKKYEASDEFCLSTLAVARKCSAYDIFHSAAKDWGFSEAKVESDFRRYLKTGDIPHYISTYVRQNIREMDHQHRFLVQPPGSLPRSWSA